MSGFNSHSSWEAVLTKEPIIYIGEQTAIHLSSVQFSSVAQSCPTLCDSMDHRTPGLPVHHQLLESTQTHVHWVGDAIQLSHPLSFPSPPALNLCQHHSLSNESALLIKWPKCWSFSFNICPSNEHPGLISCRVDWLDLLVVQGTLKSLLQHHSSKASILQHSVFFIVQLSHPYMTTGKTIALTRRTFVSKEMLFNMLSRLVITFLPRSKHLLISWLWSPSILWTAKRASCFKIYSTPAWFWTHALYLDIANKCKCYTLIHMLYYGRLPDSCVTWAENKRISATRERRWNKRKVMGEGFFWKVIVQRMERNDECVRKKK